MANSHLLALLDSVSRGYGIREFFRRSASVFYPPSVVAITSVPNVQISLKFWLLPLGHTLGLIYLFFSLTFRKKKNFTNIFRFR